MFVIYCATFSDTMTATGTPQPHIAALPKSMDRFRNSRYPWITPSILQPHYGYLFMKPVLSFVVSAVLLAAAPAAAASDVTQGNILALDRKARLLVLEDRTVWSLETLKSELATDLKAGDRIEIVYEANEDGVGTIRTITRIAPPPPREGAPDATEGTVLVYDRKARRLVLTDRTVWALEMLETPLPAGIEAGSRIHIEYESSEEGVTKIRSITPTLN